MLSSFPRAFVRPCLVGAAILAGVTAVNAMRVSPMVVEMTTTGTDSVARIEVQNLNAGRLPFETKVTRLTYDENGVTSETPADSDFLVFPPQGILPQGARQVLRVQWVGAQDMPTSQAYYLAVNQLPIPLEPGAAQNAQVQVVYHMKALVVVAPPRAQPNVSVSAVQQVPFQPQPAKAGDPMPPKVPGLEVTMKNTGRRHAMMAALKWVVEGKDAAGKPQRVVVSEEELSRAIGSGYIAGGGGVRIYRFPIARAFAPGPVTVKFTK